LTAVDFAAGSAGLEIVEGEILIEPSIVMLSTRQNEDAAMSLNSIREIERAVEALTPQEIEELRVWLDQRYPLQIDARLRADLDGGRIDARINSALADYEAGNTQAL